MNNKLLTLLLFLLFSNFSHTLSAQISVSIAGYVTPEDYAYLECLEDGGSSLNYGSATVFLKNYAGQTIETHELNNFTVGDGFTSSLDPAEVDLANCSMSYFQCTGGYSTTGPSSFGEDWISFDEVWCEIGCDDPEADNYNPGANVFCEDICYFDPSDSCDSGTTLMTMEENGNYGQVELTIVDYDGNIIFPNDIQPNEISNSLMCTVCNVTEHYFCYTEGECYILSSEDIWTSSYGGVWTIPNYGEIVPLLGEFTDGYPLGCPAMDPCLALAGEDIELLDACPFGTLVAGNEEGTWSILNGSVSIDEISNPNSQFEVLEPGVHHLVWTIQPEGCDVSADTLTITVYQEAFVDANVGMNIDLCLPASAVSINANELIFPESGTWTLLEGSGFVADATDPTTAMVGMTEGITLVEWSITHLDNEFCTITSSDTLQINVFDCVSGCTDSIACNYVPIAEEDDGTCEYISCIECIGDSNFDGAINEDDLSFIIENMGCVGNCPGDVNGDGMTTIEDIVQYGNYLEIPCE